jgi:hypothetical protein
VRILSSNEDFAVPSVTVLEELKRKHPVPSRLIVLPEEPNELDDHLVASAGGIDGLRPQILKRPSQ